MFKLPSSSWTAHAHSTTGWRLLSLWSNHWLPRTSSSREKAAGAANTSACVTWRVHLLALIIWSSCNSGHCHFTSEPAGEHRTVMLQGSCRSGCRSPLLLWHCFFSSVQPQHTSTKLRQPEKEHGLCRRSWLYKGAWLTTVRHRYLAQQSMGSPPTKHSRLHPQAWQKPGAANQRDAGTNYPAQALTGNSHFFFNNVIGSLMMEEKQKGAVRTQAVSVGPGAKQRLFHGLTSIYSFSDTMRKR